MQKFTLDAANKKVGRVASEAAKILIGKNSPDYTRNIVPNVQVEIINASKAEISLARMATSLKSRYSGHPGGLKPETVASVIEKKGHTELFHRAVYGMLPTNKLRSKMIKNLKITE
jgi:large subunit ribosomal protein L13